MIIRDVPEGAILFCTASETYFSLNPVGVLIWHLLPPVTTTEEQLVARISSAYPEVSSQQISSDVRTLIAELAADGLVEYTTAA
ncbi:MAG TPA: PqqD family protein [Gemmatimonadaceae bacterium]